MWLLCACLFAVSSAFPSRGFYGIERQFAPFNIQLEKFPTGRGGRTCVPSLFLGQICLPSAFEFFMPWHSLNVGGQRCLSIPLVRAHVIKVCPKRREEPSSSGTAGEPGKEVGGEEKEKEFQPENSNSGAEADKKGKAEKLVKNEENEGGELRQKETLGEEKNRIIRVSEETIEIDNGGPPELSDDDVSILDNLV